jgi:hypothetical protein
MVVFVLDIVSIMVGMQIGTATLRAGIQACKKDTDPKW